MLIVLTTMVACTRLLGCRQNDMRAWVWRDRLIKSSGTLDELVTGSPEAYILRFSIDPNGIWMQYPVKIEVYQLGTGPVGASRRRPYAGRHVSFGSIDRGSSGVPTSSPVSLMKLEGAARAKMRYAANP